MPTENEPKRVRRRRGATPTLLLVLFACALPACGSPPPALEVGSVRFAGDDLRGLSQPQVELLGAVAVVGEAMARGTVADAGALVLEGRVRERLVDRLREEVILERAGVSDDALRARYEGAPEYELEVRHLVVLSERWESDANRARARDTAGAALRRIAEGEPFEEVTADVSEEPGAADRGGLLRPGRRGTWVDEFWAAASALVEGEVSPVVETPFGFHVLRLERRTPLPFEEARPRVVRQVAATLGGGEAWEAQRLAWLDEVELPPAGELPPAFGSVLELVARGPSALAAPGALLATWPGGGLGGEDFLRHLLLLPAPELRRVLEDATRWAAALRTAAEGERLASLAKERGLSPTDEDRAGDARAWEARVNEWGVFLGFRPGMRPEEVAEAALAALRSTGQNARIARDGVAEAAPALLGAWPLSGTLLAAGDR